VRGCAPRAPRAPSAARLLFVAPVAAVAARVRARCFAQARRLRTAPARQRLFKDTRKKKKALKEAAQQLACRELLVQKLLPACRYFAYVQVAEEEQNLWLEYAQLLATQPQFAMRKATAASEIYPVFADLFKKAQA